MKIGLWFNFRNPRQWFRPWEQVYEESFERMTYAEHLGYDGVWLAEHHLVEDGFSPSLTAVLAAAASHTKRVALGTFVLLLPFYHPVRLAEDIATVDVISKGRVILGISAGYRAEEFAGYGIRWEDRAGIMDEGLEVLKGCLTTNNYSFSGRHFNLQNVSIYPTPTQQPHPPIYYGGATNAAIRRFARLDLDGWAGGVPKKDLFRSELEKYGRTPQDVKYVAYIRLYVGTSRQSAWREWGPYATYEHKMYREWARAAAEREPSHRAVWQTDPRRHFHAGDPEFSINKIREMVDSTPYPLEHLIVGMEAAGMPHEQVMRSMELFAKEVMPAVVTEPPHA